MTSYIQRAVTSLPTVTASAIVTGIFILYGLGLASLVVSGIHLAVGAVGYLFFVVIARWNTQIQQSVRFPVENTDQFGRLLLSVYFIFFGIATVVVSISAVRPTIYFVILTFLFIIISVQILLLDESDTKRVTVLLQLLLAHLHLALSLSLKYYYYFGKTDTLVHAGNSLNIIASRGISGVEGVYSSFPLWHVLTAIQHLLLNPGTGIWKTMFLIGGCTGVVAVLGSYLLISRIAERQTVAYFTALFVSASPTVIFYSAYSIPRSAIVGFIPIILLALLRFRDVRFMFLLLFLLVATVLYHPATPPFLILVLAGLAAISYATKLEADTRTKFYTRVTSLAVILAVGYWVYQSPTLVRALGGLLSVSTSGGTVRTPAPTTTLSDLFDRLYYAPVLLLVLFGTRWLLNNRTRIGTSQLIVGSLGFLFFFVAAPGPLDLVTAFVENFSFSRWRTYVFPFVLLSAAVGFVGITRQGNKKAKVASSLLLVALLTPALFGYPVAPDNPAVETDRSSAYFTESETTGIDRLLELSDSNVYADSQSRKLYQVRPERNRILNFQYRWEERDISIGQRGVGIYRYDEASDRSLLVRTPQRTEIRATSQELDPGLKQYSRVYDSGTVCGFI